ncbi:uncharacterized protein LOC124273040 [Haliotis rubra]|uniref:uncharacterized protein LOC124273040 n=1 Tax=Haliotis rubra TaxID=36100 RepID=UPI001EE58F10|nr:uncharacterized protein LOC124273040 [Haliotis rubra]
MESGHSSTVESDDSRSFPSLRKSWQERGISPQVADVMLQSWRGSTRKQYKTYWDRWIKFCSRKQVDSVSPPIEMVLEFLYELYSEGLSYSSLNTARSALSVLIVSTAVPVGEHPLVKRFMKGVYQARPVTSRYSDIWDANVVLDYLRKLTPVRKLSLVNLSIKLVLLFSLTTAQRGQTLHLFDIDHMDIRNKCSRVTFYLQEHIKQSRCGKAFPKVDVHAYAPDRSICPITSLNEYIARTGKLRGSETRLLISTIKPHTRVSRDTVSRWIKLGLSRAGINTNRFKAHSTRSASVSAAMRSSVPVSDILQRAGWSSAKTFAKYYNKPLAKCSSENFSQAILSSKNQ